MRKTKLCFVQFYSLGVFLRIWNAWFGNVLLFISERSTELRSVIIFQLKI
jgi:hypothetical protein